MSKNRVKNCIMAAVLIIGAISFKAGISPVAKLWKFSFEKIDEAISESKDNDDFDNDNDEKQIYHEDEPNPVDYSETEDTDGDGITDRSEIYLGLDPDKVYSDGEIHDADRVFEQQCSFSLGENFSGYTISIETESSGYIYDEAELKESELNDYYMDDRRGRAINIYKFGEIVDEGVFAGIVNKYAVEGPVFDVVYNSERKLNRLKICFNISDSSAENYMIFKSIKSEFSEEHENNLLVPVNTEYDGNTVYFDDTEPDASNINTYALVNIVKLSSFHDLVNTRYAEGILEAGLVPDEYLREMDYEFVNGDIFSDFSDTEDADGDGISDKKEMYLGLDPYNDKTEGTPDSEVKYLQSVDESLFSEINEANSKYNFYAEAVSCGNINDIITLGPSDNEELFRNDLNGRLVSVTFPDGEVDETIYGSLVHPSAIVGDIVQISLSDPDKVSMVKAGFILPDDIPEEDIQYYRVATSASSGFGQYLVANVDTRRIGRKVFYIYSKDVKSFALVDMRKLEAFSLENNGMSYEEEKQAGIIEAAAAEFCTVEEIKR